VVNHRRGGVYITVLGVAVFVTATGVGLMYATRLQGAADAAIADSAQARLCAEAGVDAVAQYISSNATWRSRAPGTWLNAVSLGSGAVTVEVTDPADGLLNDNASQPIRITAKGMKGSATHILQVDATPRGSAVSSLSVAMTTAGQLHVNSGVILNVGTSTAATNAVLRNDGTIQGSARGSTSTGGGTATLGTSTGAAALVMPPSGVIADYISHATAITPSSSTLTKVLLTPSFNSLNANYNADGVYVINSSSDLTIGSIRVLGTLIINCPGKKVTFNGPALIQPARSDYPALIVNGDLVLRCNSSASLSEVADGYNYNPLGSPYSNATDADTTDTYPNRIEGLVHASGTIDISNNQLVKGAVISDSTASSDAIRITGNATITYTPSLSTTPPLGYVSGGTPAIDVGSWKQLVAP
jgi:hypothetical protein